MANMDVDKFHLETAEKLGKLLEGNENINRSVGEINKHLKTLNGKVAQHEKFISESKGKIAVIATFFGVASTAVTLWLKSKLLR